MPHEDVELTASQLFDKRAPSGELGFDAFVGVCLELGFTVDELPPEVIEEVVVTTPRELAPSGEPGNRPRVISG